MNAELLTYLRDLITPGEAQGVEGVFVYARPGHDWGDHLDGSVHGVVLETEPTNVEDIAQAHRVLRPGGHLLLVSPPHEPTGHSAVCWAEDYGFEVRDAIMVADAPEDGARMHYVPKAARVEREAGLDHLEEKVFGMSGGAQGAIARSEDDGEDAEDSYEAAQGIGLNRTKRRRNTHPTVKPIEVMERLLRTVPTGQTVADPFMGSGTTGLAALRTGHDFIGIEREEAYLTIAEGRAHHWNRAEAGWNGASIESDLPETKVEAKTLTLDDLFGL
jgi:DNA modification methylase